MGRPGAFLEVDRKEHGQRTPDVTIQDFDEFALPLSADEQRQQASRCMMCGVAFCQTGVSFGRARTSGCPLHNLIPEFNDLLWRGMWQDAYERLSLTNPFPEFTGRVCPALCEAACNLGLHDEPTTIKDNERAISDMAWQKGYVKPLEPAADDAPRVAVVGSGPSGLACAWELARRGARVTIYERNDRPGGLLMYGIPNMKLPKDVVGRRTDLMQQSGIEVRLNADVCDPDVADKILEDSDAVVVATGATEPRPLRAPGADAEGVVYAVDYLSSATRAVLGGEPPQIDARGKDVVVIGGGDTGTDCVGTALRQQAATIQQLEFLPEPPEKRTADNAWPEWPSVKKTDYGQIEAIEKQGEDPRQWATDTIEVETKSGHVTGLHVVSLDWSSGKPERIEGSDRVLPAQLVIIACGFAGPERSVYDALGVRTEEVRGGVRPVTADGSHQVMVVEGAVFEDADGTGEPSTDDAPEATMREKPPIFAAGDARNGSTVVVNALHDGLECAAEVADTLGL